MNLSAQHVQRIAELASVELTSAERDRMLHDLNQIVEHVSRLQEVDTTAVSDAGQSLGAHNREAASLVLREDRVTPSLSHEDAMRNAPDTDGTYFRVPKVIER